MDNEINIYDIKDSAVFKYRQHAIKNANIDIDTLQRKLTALILNAQFKKQLTTTRWLYRFGAFQMYTNEDIFEIEDISWIDDTHEGYRITNEMQANLRNTYIQLGLNSKGTSMYENVINK
jgi:hypothetical protein